MLLASCKTLARLRVDSSARSTQSGGCVGIAAVGRLRSSRSPPGAAALVQARQAHMARSRGASFAWLLRLFLAGAAVATLGLLYTTHAQHAVNDAPLAAEPPKPAPRIAGDF